MNWWRLFWDGLNVRKAVTLIIVAAFVGLSLYTREGTQIAMLGTILSSVIGYWFGYENGVKRP